MGASGTKDEYTVIIDIGEAYVKVGFAGEEKPISVFPTIIGKPKFQRTLIGGDREIYVGNDCMNVRGVLKITYPISRGNIMDWDSFYSLLTHIFYNELRIDPDKANILYAENCLTPIQTKQYIARLFFETYKCKSVYIANAPILGLFSAGLTTGLLVESGEGLTWIVPIIEGQIVQHAVQKLPLAGLDVSENLKALLLRNGVNLSGTSAIREILREIKEKNCFISLDPDETAKKRDEITKYTLPDGEIVNIDLEVRVRGPEILFNPQLLGFPIDSIPQAIINAILRLDRSYWRLMLQNIVITGGNTLFPGLELRLKQEIAQLLPQLGPLPAIEKKQTKKQMVNVSGPGKTFDSCPKCGESVNLSESEYCPNCGENLENLVINIGALPSSDFPDMCPSCKKQLVEKSEFCPFCGKKIAENLVQPLKSFQSIEIPPITESFDDLSASEFEETDVYGKESIDQIIKIITPEKRQLAIFNGASILGSLHSFKNLFITHQQFLQNPELIDIDFSQIL